MAKKLAFILKCSNCISMDIHWIKWKIVTSHMGKGGGGGEGGGGVVMVNNLFLLRKSCQQKNDVFNFS